MNKEEFSRLLKEHDGNLIITTSGPLRAVFLWGVPLNIEDSYEIGCAATIFDWGYACAGSQQLSTAIMQLHIGNEAGDWYRDFALSVTNVLPNGTNTVRVNLAKWTSVFKCVDSGNYRGKNRHSYEFMQVNIAKKNEEPIWLSKFLDFPNNGLANGRFLPDTIEYTLAKELSTPEFLKWVDYITANTSRKGRGTSATINASVMLTDEALVYEGGMGEKSNFNGHLKDEFAY